mgnify:CR=1 FL=1
MTLGELVAEGGGSIQTGPFGSQLHAADYVSVGTPSVMPQNIGDNRINDSDIARVSRNDMQRLTNYWLAEGDIVYSRRGDVERRALVRPENDGWLCGTGCLRVRIGDRQIHDPAFVSYALGLKESRKWIVQHAVGATMLNLNTAILGGVPISVPSIGEQRGIAEVLGALDDKISANSRLQATIDQLVQALFIDATAGAEAATLGAVADVNLASVKPTAGELRYLDIASVSVGTYASPAASPWSSAPGRARRKISTGDTVWSTVRPNRRSHALILEDDQLLVGSTGLAVLTPKRGRFAYVYEATRTEAFTAYLEAVAEGSAYPAVRGDRFAQAPVPLPVESRIIEFEAAAGPLRMRAGAALAESAALVAMRDALLPLLMSGKVTIKDAKSVVGEVL